MKIVSSGCFLILIKCYSLCVCACVRVSYDQYDIIQFNLRTFESIGIVMMGRSKKLKYSATREIYVYKRARINNKYRT